MSLILSGTDGLSDVDGSASTPAIRGTDTNTGIYFPAADNISFSTNGTQRMRVTSGGFVGIAQSSPTSRLHIDGTSNSASATIQIVGTEVSTLLLGQNSAGGVIRGQGGSNALAFWTGGDGDTGAGQSGTERMRINSSGSLLVGITSPMGGGGGDNIRGFQVMSGNSAQMIIQNSSDACQYLAKVSGYSSGIYTNFYIADTQVGKIESNGSSTSYVTSSDYRLKENIAPMTGALAKVSTLKPVTYTWKSTGKTSQGFIAHELQEVVPDCVSGEKDATETVDIKDEDGNVIGQETKPVYQGIDTSFLVATLTAAIQEQQAIITDLKSRIETLEAK
jgi:hypothetical protein